MQAVNSQINSSKKFHSVRSKARKRAKIGKKVEYMFFPFRFHGGVCDNRCGWIRCWGWRYFVGRVHVYSKVSNIRHLYTLHSVHVYCFHHLLQYMLYITYYYYFVDTKQVMRESIEKKKIA